MIERLFENLRNRFQPIKNSQETKGSRRTPKSLDTMMQNSETKAKTILEKHYIYQHKEDYPLNQNDLDLIQTKIQQEIVRASFKKADINYETKTNWPQVNEVFEDKKWKIAKTQALAQNPEIESDYEFIQSQTFRYLNAIDLIANQINNYESLLKLNEAIKTLNKVSNLSPQPKKGFKTRSDSQ
ncbi:MAG TPA: hypothetical protein VIK81_01595 [Patescibacteria group bacterium]